MQGHAAAQRCQLRKSGRQNHFGHCADAAERKPGVFQKHKTGTFGRKNCPPAVGGNRKPAAVPQRCGTRLPDAKPAFGHPFGRRIAAHQPGHFAGQFAGGVHVHFGRTQHWPAPPRYPAPGKSLETPARHRQHRYCGGTRRRHHPRGRPGYRHWSRFGRTRRRACFSGKF